jgi:hypothetical protein
MSLGVVPHAVEPKKRSVPTVETTATVPSGECFLPSINVVTAFSPSDHKNKGFLCGRRPSHFSGRVRERRY